MDRPIAYNGNEPFIFVSYSHKDNDTVWPIINKMINDGYRVWYDNGINPGTEWDEFIATKIKNCDYFIALLSESYIASDNCKDELNYARDRVDNKLLIYLQDVELPTGMDMRLGRIQAIQAFLFDNDKHFYEKLYTSKNIESFKGNPVPAEASFINEPLKEKTEIFEVDSSSYIGPVAQLIAKEEDSTDSDMPKHVPVPKRTNIKFIILVAVASIIAIGLLWIAVYFIDDFIFFIGKYNGLAKTIKSLIVVVVCLAALAADVVVFLRLRRRFNR